MPKPMTMEEVEAAGNYIKIQFELHDPVLHIDMVAAMLFAEVKRLREEVEHWKGIAQSYYVATEGNPSSLMAEVKRLREALQTHEYLENGHQLP